MELICAVQKYDWGKLGSASLVATVAQGNNSEFQASEEVSYAELWMGTHPNGPSVIKDTQQHLSNWIALHPECLGNNSKQKFGDQLPFLFKILSIRKALSIQAHPSKEHAEQLFIQRPDLYKDPNHKPELAIALTRFEALCGFRPICEIKQHLSSIPELAAVVGQEATSELLNTDEAGMTVALKNCFRSLMSCPKPTIETNLSKLLVRLATLDESSQDRLNAELFQRIHVEYPGDVGCFCIYLLNVLTLEPGEALYLGPNEPHAYLSGDCIECMACSDNVVRAGLTPKYMDVETLCGMLTYICEPATAKRFKPHKENDYSQLFCPPVPDFAVAVMMIPGGVSNYSLIPRATASILIVTQGEASSGNLLLHKGTVIFLPTDQSFTLNVGESGISISQAFANV